MANIELPKDAEGRENPDVSLQGMVASAMNECLPGGAWSTVRRSPS